MAGPCHAKATQVPTVPPQPTLSPPSPAKPALPQDCRLPLVMTALSCARLEPQSVDVNRVAGAFQKATVGRSSVHFRRCMTGRCPAPPNHSVLVPPLPLYLPGTRSLRFPMGGRKPLHRVSKTCCFRGAVRKLFFELSCLQDRRVFFRHVANTNDIASEWVFRLSFSSLFCEVKTGAMEWTHMLRS